MKKIKFLNGMSALFALAAVALATTFTSCEKENLNVEVTPIDAQATISPIVLAVENGVTKDVTSTATVTISPSATFKGNPTLAATTATVTASYNGMSLEVKVAVPALQAGQFASLTPTIILQKTDLPTKIVMDPLSTDESTPKNYDIDNTTNYWYNQKVTYVEKKGNDVLEDSKYINPVADATELVLINSLFSTLKETYTTKDVTAEAPVYSHSRTIVSVTYKFVETDYRIIKKTVTNTRAGEDVLLASIKTRNYSTTTFNVVKTDQQIPGHNHAPAGHGHGHGHGDDGNAGGGIVLPD